QSMNAHVLTTSTSASSALAVISIPCCKTLPSIISASTRFLAQPRLIIPTFVRCSGRRVACLDLWFAADTAASTKEFSADFTGRSLLNSDVGVTLNDLLSVFLDLNGFAIENAHRNVRPVE